MPKEAKKEKDNNFSFDDENQGADNNDDLDLSQFGDEFFDQLDRQHNGAIQQTTPRQSDNNEGVEPDESGNKDDDPNLVGKDLQSLKDRYEASSREAKRLAGKVKDLEKYEPFLPVLDAINSDPQLASKVRDHLQGNLSPQAALKELNLGEDFIFDLQEAIDDPSSDSAKVFQTYTERMLDQKLAQMEFQKSRVQKEKQKEELALKEFQQKHSIPDDELQSFIEWAQSEPLTLDHLWALKNQGNRDREIINSHLAERQAHLNKIKSSHPRSLASRNASSGEASAEDKIFKLMEQLESSDNLFG